MDKEYQNLLKIIKSYLLKQPYNDEININELFDLSCSLNVPCVAGYVLKKNNKYNNIFDKSIFKSLNKYTIFEDYKKKLIKLFDDKNIKYIFIKGETLARYYDEPYLRFSSDLDVVIHKDDYDSALNLLEKELGFTVKNRIPSEVTLVNKENVNIDFHNRFEFDNIKLENLFADSFNDKELDIDRKYIFLLAHEAKHFITGQLDLRFFIDLFYLRDLINKNIVKSILLDMKLFDFDSALNSYLDYILSLHEPNEVDLELEEFILSYAKDKGAGNRVSNNADKKGYFARHAFPSFKVMKGVFPILEDKPYLLPWYYIVRIVRMLRTDRRKYVLDEFKSINKKNNNLMNELGITSYNK